MHKRSIGLVGVAIAAIVTSLAGAERAGAAGVVDLVACGTLRDSGTVYRLTADLTSCDDCLIVAANQITIDLQGHSITAALPCENSAITDRNDGRDLITVKNGSITSYGIGVNLFASTRVSVLGMTVKNTGVGIWVGSRSLVKSSEVSGSGTGIFVNDYGQVERCNTHDNIDGIFAFGGNCLITMNTANFNRTSGITTTVGDKCTVSYNTANNNSAIGIAVGVSSAGNGRLVTQNVALGNGDFDYEVHCPSTVTNNVSTNGFPDSYFLPGSGCLTTDNCCHTVNNH